MAHSRREFIKSGAALTAAAGLGLPVGSAAVSPFQEPDDGPEPDLVLINARIFTIDDDRPRAEAFAVKNDRFIAVGSTGEIRPLATGNTQIIDTEGMTVTPGFIDAHSHPSGAGVSELIYVNVDLRSVAEIKEAMKDRASITPDDEWVIGFKYDDTKLSEGRPLSRLDLDEAVPRNPAMARHRGGHTAVYNSRAFELAGVTADTPDPDDGKFYRENGELTGKVAERARNVFSRLIPSGSTREQRQAGVRLISEIMTRSGLTSVHQTGGGTNDLMAYQDAYHAGELRFRMYLFPRGGLYENLKNAGIRTGFGDEWLRIGAVKYGADGSASERTMRMSTPYIGRPDDYGILTMSQEEIHEVVEDAHRNGWQIGIHANGDVTIDMVLNAYERVGRMWPRDDPRHRIEHCSLVNPDLLQRIKDLGVIPAPFYSYVHYHGNKWVEYGPEKMRWMFAHKSFLDYGIPVAPASDYTPGPYQPLMAIQSMVTRKDFDGRVWGPNQRVSVDDAMRICTINGAYASFEENIKGSIRAGKLADFVILAEDPHDVDPDQIKNIQVVRTVVGGKTVHGG